MKACATAAFVMAVSILGTGCASTLPARSESYNGRRTDALKPYLLFDRHPGMTFATDIAARATWPSVEAGFRGRERVFFTERIYDFQGYGRDNATYFRRRFTSHRSGRIER